MTQQIYRPGAGSGSGGATAQGRLKISATTYYTIPGVEISAIGTQVVSANFIYYHGFFVPTSITVDQMAMEITTAAAAGKLVRYGVYTADINYQPVTLLADSGATAADSTGVKTASVSLALTPGYYVSCTLSDGGPVYRSYRGGSTYMGLLTTLGASAIVGESFAALTYAALPATPTIATGVNGATTPPQHHVVFRVSAP